VLIICVYIYVVPFIFKDKVDLLEKKGFEKDDLHFLHFPASDKSKKKCFRFISEPWIEKNVSKGTIEKTLQYVVESAVKMKYDIKYETFDIDKLSTAANQMLFFLSDLDKTPTNAVYESFQLK
jgi:hypothetical protein